MRSKIFLTLSDSEGALPVKRESKDAGTVLIQLMAPAEPQAANPATLDVF